MCEYCEGCSDKEHGIGVIISTFDNCFSEVKMEFFIEYNELTANVYAKTPDYIGETPCEAIKINYCPMCGRKLLNKENWIKCDSKLVRVSLDNKTNDIFKVCCMARGIEGEVCAYSVNIYNQYEYCTRCATLSQRARHHSCESCRSHWCGTTKYKEKYRK